MYSNEMYTNYKDKNAKHQVLTFSISVCAVLCYCYKVCRATFSKAQTLVRSDEEEEDCE